MKTLDKYIVRNFLATAAMCFLALMLMRIMGDLLMNIDEFSELQFSTVTGRILHIVRFYGYQSFAYFIELGGVIIVASAAFSLARMNHTNELTATLAAGVSLHRVSLPIVICAMAMGGLIILDQELIIPRIADELAISHDEKPDTMEFEVRLIDDGNGSVWYSQRYHASSRTMESPAILVRDGTRGLLAVVAGQEASPTKASEGAGWALKDGQIVPTARLGIVWPHKQDCQKVWTSLGPKAMLDMCRQSVGQDVPLDRIASANDLAMFDAAYNMSLRAGRFEPGPRPRGDDQQWTGRIAQAAFSFRTPNGQPLGQIVADQADWQPSDKGDGCWQLTGGRLFYPTDLSSDDLVLRQAGNWMDYMSTSDLARLIQRGRISDPDAAETIKHARFTAPINNLVMLLLGLPFILSRERNIKASATLSVLTVATFFAFVFICRYMGLPPLVGAWLPMFLFGPISVIMFDAVKT